MQVIPLSQSLLSHRCGRFSCHFMLLDRQNRSRWGVSFPSAFWGLLLYILFTTLCPPTVWLLFLKPWLPLDAWGLLLACPPAAMNSLVPGCITHSADLDYDADVCSAFVLSYSFTCPSCLAANQTLMGHLAKYNMAAFPVQKPSIMPVSLMLVTLLLVGTENTLPFSILLGEAYIKMCLPQSSTHTHTHSRTYHLFCHYW